MIQLIQELYQHNLYTKHYLQGVCDISLVVHLFETLRYLCVFEWSS